MVAGQSSGVRSPARLSHRQVVRRSTLVAWCSSCTRSYRTAAGNASAGRGSSTESRRQGDAVTLRMIAGEHYPLTILGIPHTTVCGSFSPRSIEEVAPEDLGWIDIILNGQI